MGGLVKPKNLTPAESWAWDNSEPGSWQRRGLAWAKERERARGPSPEEKRERVRRDLRERGRPCYVRFREPPPGGISRNHNTGKAEPGLCVFDAFETPEGDYYVDPGEAAGRRGVGLLTMYRVCATEGFPAYLATGWVAGVGTDGEPCLVDYELTPIPPERVRGVWEVSAGEKVGTAVGMLLKGARG